MGDKFVTVEIILIQYRGSRGYRALPSQLGQRFPPVVAAVFAAGKVTLVRVRWQVAAGVGGRAGLIVAALVLAGERFDEPLLEMDLAVQLHYPFKVRIGCEELSTGGRLVVIVSSSRRVLGGGGTAGGGK
uniref:Uncharacterized protein n=1 Tax=Anopheles atroparvus TaxID=41427 RepID=A0A182JFB7_ANOAO